VVFDSQKMLQLQLILARVNGNYTYLEIQMKSNPVKITKACNFFFKKDGDSSKGIYCVMSATNSPCESGKFLNINSP